MIVAIIESTFLFFTVLDYLNVEIKKGRFKISMAILRRQIISVYLKETAMLIRMGAQWISRFPSFLKVIGVVEDRIDYV